MSEMITIKGCEGGEVQTEMVFGLGPLAVTKDIDHDGWVVTHLESSACLPFTFVDSGNAINAIIDLVDTVDVNEIVQSLSRNEDHSDILKIIDICHKNCGVKRMGSEVISAYELAERVSL